MRGLAGGPWGVETMRFGWQRVLSCVLACKAAYLGLLYAALWAWPAFDVKQFYVVMMHWPRSGGPLFASHFATWDAAHYLFLTEVGYGPGARSDAFYPLWPLLLRWCSTVAGGHVVAIGMLLTNGLSAVAWVGFHRVSAARFGESTANWALAWLVLFPGSLFYQFIYSESVFFLLLMGLWYGLERRRYALAFVSALLLPLARGVGLFCVLPIAWHLMMRWPPRALLRWAWVSRERGLTAREVTNGHRSNRSESAPRRRLVARVLSPWCLFVAPLLGFGVYLVLMWSSTGNPFEGIEAQKYWDVHSIGNLWNLPKFVFGWFTPTDWHAFRGSGLDRVMFLVLVYTLPVIWRLGKDLLVWTYVLGVLPAMSGTFTSYTRFASCAFPIFIALAVFFEGRKLPWMKWALLTAFCVLHIGLLWRFVNFRWAG